MAPERRSMFLSHLLLVVASLIPRPVDEPEPIQIFLLAGQSNMEGQAVVDLVHEKYYNGGRGTLIRLLDDPAMAKRMGHLRQANGEWTVRDDVWVRYRTGNDVLKSGPLSIGYAVYDDLHHFGPELQLGHVLGDAIDAPILLIKTCWGGKSLHVDFRPPGAGGETGPYYQQMVAEYREALEAIDKEFPQLADRPRKLSGFFWFQGWNDMFDGDALKEYEANLINLVKDVRKEFRQPNLPVVIGELGNGGPKAGNNMLAIRKAQKAAAKALGPNTMFVQTSQFARPAKESPNVGHGHHWYGNAESYFLIGDALGQALLRLTGK